MSNNNPCRLLLLNPNTSESMTDGLERVARLAAREGTDILPMTLTRGFPYISSRAEAQICGALAMEAIATREHEIDAVIIAAFGDPGLKAARELFDFPVIGMAEAAMLTAVQLGERFSIVTFTPAMSRWYLDSIHEGGMSQRFASLRTPDHHDGDVADVKARMRSTLCSLVDQCVKEDGADVVILGGAPLAGLAAELQPDVQAMLIDPVWCAVRQAEALVGTATPEAWQNRFRKPLPKSSTGLDAALAQRMGND
ncbi:MAG: aspartate/glutamate racemase family protein [Granulosicoccus sp.]